MKTLLTTITPSFSPSPWQDGDFLVSGDHPVHGERPWTQQSLGCGRPGDFIYLPRSFVFNAGEIVAHNEQNDTRRNEVDNTYEDYAEEDPGLVVRDQWLRYQYGVFDSPGKSDPSAAPRVGTRQHKFCDGRSVADVVNGHSDMLTSRSRRGKSARVINNVNVAMGSMRITLSRRNSPRYVVVLENSRAMDEAGRWEIVRKATKKFITNDLSNSSSIALVLFNKDAHVANRMEFLDTPSRGEEVASKITNGFQLFPGNSSCIRCGILKAVKALQQVMLVTFPIERSF